MGDLHISAAQFLAAGGAELPEQVVGAAFGQPLFGRERVLLLHIRQHKWLRDRRRLAVGLVEDKPAGQILVRLCGKGDSVKITRAEADPRDG